MTDLFLHGRSVRTVFQLLGETENDITYSLGWLLANCPEFLALFLGQVAPETDAGQIISIHLQATGGDGGYTDVEVIAEHLHLIIEAKKGWTLPTDEQLGLYASRLAPQSGPPPASTPSEPVPGRLLLVISECSDFHAIRSLPPTVKGVPVRHVSWAGVASCASASSGDHASKRLLREFVTYIRSVITMQNKESNRVYVVALAAKGPTWSASSWRDIVNVHGRYFHPLNHSWPKIPPNYIGFRYDNHLQGIHHVEAYQVTSDPHSFAATVPGIDPDLWLHSEDYVAGPMITYTLGPRMKPLQPIPTGGNIMAARMYAALDLLLTSSSILEAVRQTKVRLGE